MSRIAAVFTIAVVVQSSPPGNSTIRHRVVKDAPSSFMLYPESTTFSPSGNSTIRRRLVKDMPKLDDPFSFVLNSESATYSWRHLAERPTPSFGRVLTWTKHDQVGIGNALGGYASALLEAIEQDRVLVMYSIIMLKFCEVLPCRIHHTPAHSIQRYSIYYFRSSVALYKTFPCQER